MYFDFSQTHPVFQTIAKLTNNLCVYQSLFKVYKNRYISINIEAENGMPVLSIITSQAHGNAKIVSTFTLYLSGSCGVETTLNYIDAFSGQTKIHTVEHKSFIREQVLGVDLYNQSRELFNELQGINLTLQASTTIEVDPYDSKSVMTQEIKDSRTLTYEEMYCSEDFADHNEIIPAPETTIPM